MTSPHRMDPEAVKVMTAGLIGTAHDNTPALRVHAGRIAADLLNRGSRADRQQNLELTLAYLAAFAAQAIHDSNHTEGGTPDGT